MLLNETKIGMTPLSSISRLPFGGAQTHVVQLVMEGIFLLNFAILTITPPQEIPVARQILF